MERDIERNLSEPISALAAPQSKRERLPDGIRTAVTKPEHGKRMQRPAHCHRKTGGPWRQGGKEASCNHGRSKASAEENSRTTSTTAD